MWLLRLIIICLCTSLLFLPSASGTTDRDFDLDATCFSQALRASQSCSNEHLQYTPLLGYSGLGSEFEWLMTALLYAVMHQRRLVYLETPHIPWKYSCAEKRGWACFLSLNRCPGDHLAHTPLPPPLGNLSNHSILLRKGRKDFVIMNNNNGWIRHAVFQYAWSGQVHPADPRRDTRLGLGLYDFPLPSDAPKAKHLRDLYRVHKPPNETLLHQYRASGALSASCDARPVAAEMEMLATRRLFRLSPATSAAVTALNQQLHPLLVSVSVSATPPPPPPLHYHSLQIRLTDKQQELSPEVWAWITNTSNIVAFIQPYFSSATVTADSRRGGRGGSSTSSSSREAAIRDLYVATDACHTVSELRGLLPASITVHSSCDYQQPVADSTSNSNSHSNSNSFSRREIGTQRDYLGAIKLLADVQMLRGGVRLFGLAQSNVVRLARRLQFYDRDPWQQQQGEEGEEGQHNFHALGP